MSTPSGASRSSGHDVDLRLGREQLRISDRYEVASILNDLLIAAFFIVGSILFFQESTSYAGTWLFLLGSIELAVRPLIRLARRVHLTRIPGERLGRRRTTSRVDEESPDEDTSALGACAALRCHLVAPQRGTRWSRWPKARVSCRPAPAAAPCR